MSTATEILIEIDKLSGKQCLSMLADDLSSKRTINDFQLPSDAAKEFAQILNQSVVTVWVVTLGGQIFEYTIVKDASAEGGFKPGNNPVFTDNSKNKEKDVKKEKKKKGKK